jgi:hypothetical protein
MERPAALVKLRSWRTKYVPSCPVICQPEIECDNPIERTTSYAS